MWSQFQTPSLFFAAHSQSRQQSKGGESEGEHLGASAVNTWMEEQGSDQRSRYLVDTAPWGTGFCIPFLKLAGHPLSG